MMKTQTSAILLALSLVLALLTPGQVNADSLTITPNQGNVGALITIPGMCSYGTGNYYIYWGEENQILGQGVITEGCPTINFTVPEVPQGMYKVTLKMGERSFYDNLDVTPSINLNSDNGAVGSKLTVAGTGFNANETGIKVTYDDNLIATGIQSDDKGSWQTTFQVPTCPGGAYVINAEGTTAASDVDDRLFTVTPEISLSLNSGWVGTMVSVTGSGFGSEETNIKVIYDGLAVKTGIAADTEGSWQSGFAIPTSKKGSHLVNAFGATTSENNADEVIFIVSPGIKIELASGYLGDSIYPRDNLLVSGFGFDENETGIRTTFDGTAIADDITADAQGSWVASCQVPLSTKGEHTLDSSGDITSASDVADAIMVISPRIELSPTSGAVGDDIIVSGTGFSGKQVLDISYDGDPIATGLATDTNGSFTISFKAPKSEAGEHAVTAIDATASIASAILTIESTPPPVPQLVSPEAGSRIGFVGKTTVVFDWSDVTDPSGVSYTLEISLNSDFSSTMFHGEELVQSQYTLTDSEALGKGEYYWRVNATDGAGNQSDWSPGQLLRIGVMELWVLIVIILGSIAAIAAIVWRVISISRRSGWG